MRLPTAILSAAAVLSVTTLGAGPAIGAGSGDASAESTGGQQDSVKVVPYEKRAKPTHRVSLKDGRVFFVKKLDETDSGYVLHTLENEDIEVDESEVEEIVDLEKK